MKPVNLEAQLAAVETELTCLKIALAQAREDREELRQERDGLRQERDAWRTVAEKPTTRSKRLMSGTSLPRSASHGDAVAERRSPISGAVRPLAT